MRLTFFLLFFSCLVQTSCTSDITSSSTATGLSFYHWKTDLKNNTTERQAVIDANVQRLFVHYFDLSIVPTEYDWEDNIYPIAVLREMADYTKNMEVIPVVYIPNKVMKGDVKIEELKEKIQKLINQIHQKHLGSIPSEIQLDCDWTATTQNNFFQLVEALKNDYKVNTTIRLHQIKYQEKTDIPNAHKGTLMVYNIGDLKDFSKNSILETSILQDYINASSSYPLPLDIAFPLYAQGVAKNKEGKLKLISGLRKDDLEQHPQHFQATGNDNYKVLTDTLFRGLFLYPEYTIKIEETTAETVLAAQKIIEESQLQTEQTIFYHLDEKTLKGIDFEEILEHFKEVN